MKNKEEPSSELTRGNPLTPIEDLQHLLNRRMRSSMYGGVVRVPGNGYPYPISAIFWYCDSATSQNQAGALPHARDPRSS